MNTMPFIRNSWYVASWARELTASHPCAVTIIDEQSSCFGIPMARPLR